MKKIIFSLLFTTILNAQGLFQIQLDISRFSGDKDNAFVEIYYSFDVSKLSYVKTGNELRSDAIITFICKRSSDDSVVASEQWRAPFTLNDSTLLTETRIYTDLISLFLKDDLYRITFKINDGTDFNKSDSVQFIYDVTTLSNKKVSLSDLELATTITSSTDNKNRFYKNSFEVKPNPSKIYGTHLPVIFYYVESYNLNLFPNSQYTTKTSIKNAFGKEVQFQEKLKRNIYNSSVDVGLLKINSLRTGAYQLIFEINDSLKNNIASTYKKFFVYNSNLSLVDSTSTDTRSMLATEYATFTEDELNREFEIAKYIALKNEVDQFKKIKNIIPKINFLIDFWAKRDLDLSTPENEFKINYFQRVEKVNATYKTGFKEGWKTDRGRVWIVYGEPDEIERHNNEVDSKPYEIWFYNSLQGGVRFFFGDRTGFSDYILLHSTHRDEMHDENWMKYIQSQ